MPWKYLQFFLDDDARLKQIGEDYAAGRLLTGEVKAILIDVLTTLVTAHQARRARVDEGVVSSFTRVRPMEGLLDGLPLPPPPKIHKNDKPKRVWGGSATPTLVGGGGGGQ